MRNDRKGRITDDDGIESHYASGKHGPEVMANGDWLKCGFYAKADGCWLLGPFNTRAEAVTAVQEGLETIAATHRARELDRRRSMMQGRP